ncbi:hypothetical protein CDL12_15315 [Handroanthus impetiginosus]|uniref:PHD-type zinc finger plants domain-containing protein n=1 Tax=Handroanthus impetiginosus TaxID=429701 RepID=A0A2G9H3H9_9LAMI|nr:hypothetical protein CDL12_15315 [Handroanthus impetiginosus]
MGRNGEEGGAAECCMCGDYGISSELFTCKHCRFRSQHKYCSNLYPEAESYNICNWCLSQKNDIKGEEKAKRTSPKSSSISQKATKDDIKMNQSKKVLGGLKDIKKASNQMIKIKHTKLPGDRSDGGVSKKIIRRTRSSDAITNRGIIIKQVSRNKVRRYKLLDEVSS